MHLTVLTDTGTLEVNFMWLPTFIGMNPPLMKDLEEAVKHRVVGQPVTEAFLTELDEILIEFLTSKFPHPGLADYLDGLKFVTFGHADQ